MPKKGCPRFPETCRVDRHRRQVINMLIRQAPMQCSYRTSPAQTVSDFTTARRIYPETRAAFATGRAPSTASPGHTLPKLLISSAVGNHMPFGYDTYRRRSMLEDKTAAVRPASRHTRPLLIPARMAARLTLARWCRRCDNRRTTTDLIRLASTR